MTYTYEPLRSPPGVREVDIETALVEKLRRALDENSVVKESLTTARGHAKAATVKQLLTIVFGVVKHATTEEFSAVGSAGAALAVVVRRA